MSNILLSVKNDLRITHDRLDEDIQENINACLSDLNTCGVFNLATDPQILAAIKLYCRAQYTDDTQKAADYITRYERLKGSLMLAGEYGNI